MTIIRVDSRTDRKIKNPNRFQWRKRGSCLVPIPPRIRPRRRSRGLRWLVRGEPRMTRSPVEDGGGCPIWRVGERGVGFWFKKPGEEEVSRASLPLSMPRCWRDCLVLPEPSSVQGRQFWDCPSVERESDGVQGMICNDGNGMVDRH